MTHDPVEPAAGDLKTVEEIVEVIDEGELVEIVEIEVFAKENKKPPRAKKYKFRIDREHFVVDHRIITVGVVRVGQEIAGQLADASKTAWRSHEGDQGRRQSRLG
jgi:hypothetical protein